jgi:hypothetical protein
VIHAYTYSEIHKLKPGEVSKCPETGRYYACTPNDHLANLMHHEVTEHEDGTITVSPSISVSTAEAEVYHGFLERGQWRSA